MIQLSCKVLAGREKDGSLGDIFPSRSLDLGVPIDTWANVLGALASKCIFLQTCGTQDMTRVPQCARQASLDPWQDLVFTLPQIFSPTKCT